MKKIYLSLIIIFSANLFSQSFEENLDIYCDYDGDGKSPDCDLYEQFANNNWATKDWRGSIDQRLDMITCKCYKKDISKQMEIYEYLGRSYEKEGILDSAAWALKQGVKKDGDNKLLIELVAWVLDKQIKLGDKSKIEDQIYYLEKLLDIDSEDLTALEKMSDTYKNNSMFDEQIEVLNRWLKIDPSNNKALKDKKNAYESLGYDAAEVDKERWEQDPTNLEYGISYIKSLLKNSDFDRAIEVCEELLVFHSDSKRLLKLTSESYSNNYDDKKAVRYLKQLVDLDPNDISAIIDLSIGYVNLAEFKDAYNWIDKAVKSNKMIGQAYYQRADVLVQLVDYYRDDELDFCDRLVYDLASEDYMNAYKNGQLKSKIYMNNLKELVSQKGDWFMLGDQFEKLSPGSKECSNRKKSDCYEFIKREVEAK